MIYKIDDAQAAQEFKEYINENKFTIKRDGAEISAGEDKFIFEPEFTGTADELCPIPKPISPYDNDLIYGKDKTEGITAVEEDGNNLVLFKNDGTTEIRPLTYYFLTPTYLPGSSHVKGNGYYKYLSTFQDEANFEAAKQGVYKRRIDAHKLYDAVESAMIKDGITLFKGVKLAEVSVLAFDIETTGLAHDQTSKVTIISNTFRDANGVVTRRLFSVDDYNHNDRLMILDWCKWVRQVDPSILTGHNLFNFDFPYLSYCYVHRDTIGPDTPGPEYNLPLGRMNRSVYYDSRVKKFRKEADQFYEFFEPHVFGRQIIDGLFTSYKYDIATRKYKSNGLKSIIETEKELMKEAKKLKKASAQQLELLARMDRPRTFWDFAEKPPQKIYGDLLKGDTTTWQSFKDYARDDADDSLILYDMMIPSFFYLTQIVPMQFQTLNNTATGRQINTVLLRSYLQAGYGVPKASQKEKYGGGMSFGNPGVYRHVYKVDVASLYPSIIISKRISDERKDPKGHFLELVTILTKQRLEYKAKGGLDKYFKDMSEAFKIFINSMYGLLGANGLNFNNFALADLVTSTGREILQKGVEWACGRRLVKEDKTLKDGSPKIDHETGEVESEWRIDLSQKYPGNNYKLVNVDTDSFSYSTTKKMSPEEFAAQITEINKLSMEGINWENDGYYEKFLVVRTKNYVTQKPKETMKLKGSGLKSRNREKALQDFQNDVIVLLLDDKRERIYHLYHKVAKALVEGSIDIRDWSKTKTVTSKVFNPTTPELASVKKALTGQRIQEGDRVSLFVKAKGELCLVEKYDGTYDKDVYLDKLYNVLDIFCTVLDLNVFPNFKNKANKELL